MSRFDFPATAHIVVSPIPFVHESDRPRKDDLL